MSEKTAPVEEPRVERFRRLIEEQYQGAGGTGCGGSFGEILCHEIHTKQEAFSSLAQKWGISLPTLGELVRDHCCRLEEAPAVSDLVTCHCTGCQEFAEENDRLKARLALLQIERDYLDRLVMTQDLRRLVAVVEAALYWRGTPARPGSTLYRRASDGDEVLCKAIDEYRAQQKAAGETERMGGW